MSKIRGFTPEKVALSCLLLQERGLQAEWAGPVVNVERRRDLVSRNRPEAADEAVGWKRMKVCFVIYH